MENLSNRINRHTSPRIEEKYIKLHWNDTASLERKKKIYKNYFAKQIFNLIQPSTTLFGLLKKAILPKATTNKPKKPGTHRSLMRYVPKVVKGVLDFEGRVGNRLG